MSKVSVSKLHFNCKIRLKAFKELSILSVEKIVRIDFG